MSTLFLLLAGHSLADFGLQSDWLAANKIPGSFPYWPDVLLAHSFIHGLMVFLATQSLWLAVGETVAHFAIDYAKGRQLIGFQQDQALHVACKIVWFFLVGVV